MTDDVEPDKDEVVLSPGWETNGEGMIEPVSDKEILEYLMGFDVRIKFSGRIAKGKREGQIATVCHHEVNRRGEMVAHIRIIESKADIKAVGQEMKIGVSHVNGDGAHWRLCGGYKIVYQ